MMLFSLPFIGIGAFAGLMAVRSYESARAMQAWQPVQAELLDYALREHRSKDAITHEATARYRYAVDGRIYESTRVGIQSGSDNIGSWQTDRYADLQRAAAAGGAITAYVNPAKPDESILFPELRPGMLWVAGAFAAIFGLTGLGVFVAGWVALFKTGASARRAREFPTEPWRWRPEWADGAIKPSNRAGAVGSTVFAGLWTLVSGTAAAAAFLNRDQVAWPAILITSLFVIVGLGLMGWAIREWRVVRRYGDALFHLASVPGVLGGKLAGVVAVPAYAEPYESYDVELACQRTVRRGKNTTTETLWKDQRRLDPSKLPAKVDGVQIPVLFAIPYDLPPCEDPVHWRLRVRGKQAGPDLDLQFEVPVFRTAESRPDFQLDSSGIAPYELKTSVSSSSDPK